jgi:hypothetical protein
MIRLRSNVSVEPFQMKRSTRFPSRGTARMSPVSAPSSGVSEHRVAVGKNGSSGGGGGARHVQKR